MNEEKEGRQALDYFRSKLGLTKMQLLVRLMFRVVMDKGSEDTNTTQRTDFTLHLPHMEYA